MPLRPPSPPPTRPAPRPPRAPSAPTSPNPGPTPTRTVDEFDLSGADPEAIAELKDLVLATIADVMETGSPEQQVDMVKKFGPAILKEHIDQTGGVDIESAFDTMRQMMRRTGAAFFEDPPLKTRTH